MKWRNGLFDFIRKLRGDGKGQEREDGWKDVWMDGWMEMEEKGKL